MNLQKHTLSIGPKLLSYERRVWMKAALFSSGWYLSHAIIPPEDRFLATSVGVVACICVELTLKYASEVKHRCVSVRRAQYTQKTSGLLQLPNEMKFEIAQFLTAEDLLVARATCHKVNDMLEGESARFWLHTRLRRAFLHQNPSNRIHGTTVARVNRAKLLVYDAVAFVLTKITGTSRDPVQILRSNNENDCLLKWMYLNADWIRKQNLPPLEKDGEDENDLLVRLTAGDAAFTVFRHIPNKSSLGIISTYDEDFAIESIDVPRRIYGMIQRDPFSFMAAETLSARTGTLRS